MKKVAVLTEKCNATDSLFHLDQLQANRVVVRLDFTVTKQETLSP